MAQTLARHSDIRLTLGVYTQVGLHDQSAAIAMLPGPPDLPPFGIGTNAIDLRGTIPRIPQQAALPNPLTPDARHSNSR